MVSNDFSKIKLFVATPCYAGNVHVNYMQSVMGLQQLCDRLGIKMQFYTVPFDSLIPRARNVCANVFMKSDATHLFFIDADIMFVPAQVIQMLKHDTDIICGAYPKKVLRHELIQKHAEKSTDFDDLICKSTAYAINFVHNNGSILVQNGIAEIKDAPTGFLMIKKDVLKNIMKDNPNSYYKNDIRAYGYGTEFFEFFPCGIFDGRYLSEDYGFCRLCQKLDYKVYVDVNVKLTHIGQFNYHGNLVQQLQST